MASAGSARLRCDGLHRFPDTILDIVVADTDCAERCPQPGVRLERRTREIARREIRADLFELVGHWRHFALIELLKWNDARGHYDFGPINWDEFWRVLGGHGACNQERLSARVKAWEDGAWVREAALAYARKSHTQEQAA